MSKNVTRVVLLAVIVPVLFFGFLSGSKANASVETVTVSHSVTVTAHVAHMQHVVRVLNHTVIHHYPACRNEDGSGQWYCAWNAQTSGNHHGVSFTMRVVNVFNNGDVLRRYHYLYDGHNEYLREMF